MEDGGRALLDLNRYRFAWHPSTAEMNTIISIDACATSSEETDAHRYTACLNAGVYDKLNNDTESRYGT